MKKCEKVKKERPRQVCVKAPETSIIGAKCNPLQYNQESLSPRPPPTLNQESLGPTPRLPLNQESSSPTRPTNDNFAVGLENPASDEQWLEASLYSDDSASSEEFFN